MSRHNLPALQFYPGDWRKAPDVQALSYHDRGVWFEMLMLMHESEQRGKLMLNGQPMSEDALARILGMDKQEVKTCLSTLLTYGVASLEPETGIIFCRRMVRDESVRQQKVMAGKLGGNPALLKHTPKQKPTTGVKQNGGSSVSTSTSVGAPTGADVFELSSEANVSKKTVSDRFEEFWSVVWLKIGKGSAKKAWRRKVKTQSRADFVIAQAQIQGPDILTRAEDAGITPIHPATWLNQERYDDEGYVLVSKPRPALTLQDKLLARALEAERKEAAGAA